MGDGRHILTCRLKGVTSWIADCRAACRLPCGKAGLTENGFDYLAQGWAPARKEESSGPVGRPYHTESGTVAIANWQSAINSEQLALQATVERFINAK